MLDYEADYHPNIDKETWFRMKQTSTQTSDPFPPLPPIRAPTFGFRGLASGSKRQPFLDTGNMEALPPSNPHQGRPSGEAELVGVLRQVSEMMMSDPRIIGTPRTQSTPSTHQAMGTGSICKTPDQAAMNFTPDQAVYKVLLPPLEFILPSEAKRKSSPINYGKKLPEFCSCPFSSVQSSSFTE